MYGTNTFLFSTTNFTGMKLNLLKEESIDETKWNELKFPENCRTIKKVVCGLQIVAFCNELNEIYYFGKLEETNDNKLWHKLNYNVEIKNLFANYNSLIIQPENNDLIICAKGTTVTKKFNDIKLIECGPLSMYFIVIGKNNIVKEISDGLQEKTIDTSEVRTSIKCIGCSAKSKLLVTMDNKIYGCGPDVFGEMGGLNNVSLDKFIRMPTQFESEIIDVKGGFYHFVILLRNGEVYAIGYNYLGQVCVDHQNNTSQFTKLSHPLFENDLITRINCSARGTVLISKTDVVYFIGEVVNNLVGYDEKLDKNIEQFNINGNIIQKVTLDKYNDVVPGGWHYIIYNNPNLKGKSLQYFEQNLKSLTHKAHRNDISIVTIF